MPHARRHPGRVRGRQRRGREGGARIGPRPRRGRRRGDLHPGHPRARPTRCSTMPASGGSGSICPTSGRWAASGRRQPASGTRPRRAGSPHPSPRCRRGRTSSTCTSGPEPCRRRSSRSCRRRGRRWSSPCTITPWPARTASTTASTGPSPAGSRRCPRPASRRPATRAAAPTSSCASPARRRCGTRCAAARSTSSTSATRAGRLLGDLLGGYASPITASTIRSGSRRGRRRRPPAATPIAYVGRLTREKGADLVADAARAAGLPALFVGAGPLDAELRARPGVGGGRLAGAGGRLGDAAQPCPGARRALALVRDRAAHRLRGAGGRHPGGRLRPVRRRREGPAWADRLRGRPRRRSRWPRPSRPCGTMPAPAILGAEARRRFRAEPMTIAAHAAALRSPVRAAGPDALVVRRSIRGMRRVRSIPRSSRPDGRRTEYNILPPPLDRRK